MRVSERQRVIAQLRARRDRDCVCTGVVGASSLVCASRVVWSHICRWSAGGVVSYLQVPGLRDGLVRLVREAVEHMAM